MRTDRAAGFTLLEALIAFAILALALTALLQGTLSGLHATQAAGRTEEALARARSRLAGRDGGTPREVRLETQRLGPGP